MRTPHAHHPRNAERTLRRRLASASLQAPLDARQGEVIRGDRLGVGDASGADGLLHLVHAQAQHLEELAFIECTRRLPQPAGKEDLDVSSE